MSPSRNSLLPWLTVSLGSLHRLIASRRYFGALLLVLMALQLLCLDSYLDTGGDNALYIILARSLAERNGYRLANTPDNMPFVKFPPLFPVLLAPLTLPGGSNLQLLKLLSVVPFWLALLPLYYLVQPALGVSGARILILLSITNPWLYRYANIVRPEGLYLLFSLATLVLSTHSKDRTAPGLLSSSLAALCAALAFLSRSIGASLMIALLVALAWRRHWRGVLATIAIYAVVLAPWLVYIWSLPAEIRQDNYLREIMALGGDTHGLKALVTQLAHFGRLALKNFPIYTTSWAGTLFYAPTRFFDLIARYIAVFALVNSLLGLAVLASLMGGVLLSLRQGVDSLSIYIVGYMLICLLWPWQGEKFFVPIIPIALYILAISAVHFAEALLGRFGWRNLPVMPALVVLLLVINLAGDTVIYVRRAMNPYSPEWQSYFTVADWTTAHLSEDAVVMARKPYLFHLRSGHLTVSYPSVEDDTSILKYVHSCGANYIVVGTVYPEEEDLMAGVINRHKEMFTVEYAIGPPATKVYRVLP